jgi:hypothetical protein
MKCVFGFSLQFLTEIFFIVRRTEGDSIIDVHRSSYRVPVILVVHRSSYKVPVSLVIHISSYKVPVILVVHNLHIKYLLFL